MEKRSIEAWHDRAKWKIFLVQDRKTLFFTELGAKIDNAKINDAWLFYDNDKDVSIVRQVASDEFIILAHDTDYSFDHLKMASGYECIRLRHYVCDAEPQQITGEIYSIPWANGTEKLYSARYRNTIENLVLSEIEDAVMLEPLKVSTTICSSHIEVALAGPVEIKFQIQHEYTGIDSLEPITKCYSKLRKRFITVTKLEDVNRIVQEDSEDIINAKQFVSEGGYYVDGKKVKDAMHYSDSFATAKEIWKNLAKEELLRENQLAEIVNHKLYAISFYDKVDCNENFTFYANANRILILEHLEDEHLRAHIYELFNPSAKCKGAKQISDNSFVILVEHGSAWSMERIELGVDSVRLLDNANLDTLNCMDDEDVIFTPIGRLSLTDGLLFRHCTITRGTEIDRILVRNLDEEGDWTYYLSVRYDKGEGEDNYIFYLQNLEQTETDYSESPKGFNYYNKSFFEMSGNFNTETMARNEVWQKKADELLETIPT